MDTKHTPTPWEFIRDDNIILGNGGRVMSWQTRSIDSSVAERDANAAFIVRAVNSHDQWAKWIVQRGPGLPDHACADCLPHSDMLKPGFQCVYHEALAAAEA